MKKPSLIQIVFLAIPITAALLFSSCSHSEEPFSQTVQAPIGDIRAIYLELGHNMWCDWPTPAMLKEHTLEEACKLLPPKKHPDLKLSCEDSVWTAVTNHAAKKGVNLIVVDLGEGLFYPSHPELAIEGTWSVEKMRSEIKRLNALGIEVIPKLNFSNTHNGWMKDYRHMVSSEPYLKMCSDVIADAMETFGNPRFFHIGFDEENDHHQKQMAFQCKRTDEVWLHDLLYIIKEVESHGARAWMWSDYGWYHPEFFTRCPKSVIQLDWYYDECNGGFDPATNHTDDYARLIEFWNLEKEGFDQIPCGTHWVGYGRREAGVDADDVIGRLVKLGREVVSKDHLYGFMMALWSACTTEGMEDMMHGIDLFSEAFE